MRIRPQQRPGDLVRRGQIPGPHDDRGELAPELQHRPEDPQVGPEVRGRAMGEANRQRLPPNPVQLAVEAVQL